MRTMHTPLQHTSCHTPPATHPPATRPSHASSLPWTPLTMDRIPDTRFLNNYLAPTSLRSVTRMHSSMMRTARTLLYRGGAVSLAETETPPPIQGTDTCQNTTFVCGGDNLGNPGSAIYFNIFSETACDGICADKKNTDEPVFTICDGICMDKKYTDDPVFTICDGICADINTPMI